MLAIDTLDERRSVLLDPVRPSGPTDGRSSGRADCRRLGPFAASAPRIPPLHCLSPPLLLRGAPPAFFKCCPFSTSPRRLCSPLITSTFTFPSSADGAGDSSPSRIPDDRYAASGDPRPETRCVGIAACGLMAHFLVRLMRGFCSPRLASWLALSLFYAQCSFSRSSRSFGPVLLPFPALTHVQRLRRSSSPYLLFCSLLSLCDLLYPLSTCAPALFPSWSSLLPPFPASSPAYRCITCLGPAPARFTVDPRAGCRPGGPLTRKSRRCTPLGTRCWRGAAPAHAHQPRACCSPPSPTAACASCGISVHGAPRARAQLSAA